MQIEVLQCTVQKFEPKINQFARTSVASMIVIDSNRFTELEKDQSMAQKPFSSTAVFNSALNYGISIHQDQKRVIKTVAKLAPKRRTTETAQGLSGIAGTMYTCVCVGKRRIRMKQYLLNSKIREARTLAATHPHQLVNLGCSLKRRTQGSTE